MAEISYYLSNKLLEGTVKATTYTAPANVYMALFSTTCNVSAAGTEITGNGYARQLVSFGTANNASIASSANVNFSATGNSWPAAVSVGIMDASTSGNLMYFTNLNKVVAAGDTLTFENGSVTITIL